jgi:DNA-binding transcriptional LysR family regulator
MTRHLDLALLRTFLAVAETGSATRAAARVHVTQAAVSQQLKRLEETVGRQLLVRDRKGFRLTSSGERLLVQAQRLLALNDETWASMAAPDQASEVVLGVPCDLLHPFLPPILKRFKAEWPGAAVRFVSATTPRLIAAYGRGEVDLCMTTELDCPRGAELLFPDPLVWVGAPGGEAWLREPLPVALGDSTCAFRKPVLEAIGRAERSWDLVAEWSEMTSVQAVVEADLGVTALLVSTVPSGLAVIQADKGLPALPAFNVNLYPPRPDSGRAALELARLIRQTLGAARRRLPEQTAAAAA